MSQVQSGWKLETSRNAVRTVFEHFLEELSCLHLLWGAALLGSALVLEIWDGLRVGC